MTRVDQERLQLSRPSRLAVRFIDTYRNEVSSRLHSRCSFQTSCSDYGLHAYLNYGFTAATLKTIWRILRCTLQRPVDRRGERARRHTLHWAATVFTSVGLLTLLAIPVQAEITPGCSGQINGVDVAPLSSSSPNDAIPVKEHTSVPVGGQASAPITRVRVQLEYGGFRWTVTDQPNSGTSWQSSVAVDQYAKYGVGLYKVVAESSGAGTCIGSALVNVEGNPLKTAAGIAGGVTAAVGVVGMAYTGGKAASARSLKRTTSAEVNEMFGPSEEVQEAERNLEDAKRIRDQPMTRDELERPGGINTDLIRMRREAVLQAEERLSNARMMPPRPKPHVIGRTCVGALLPALLLTGVAMFAVGESGAQVQRPAPRIPWKPRISVLGLISGGLTGLGTLVLAQQYALVFPTRTTAIVWLALGVVLGGIVIPSLLRFVAIGRINRHFAKLQ